MLMKREIVSLEYANITSLRHVKDAFVYSATADA